MFIFPILYVCLFIASLYYLTQKQQKGLFLFLLFGLPIYIISLSVAHMYDFTKMVPFMQSFKEVVIVIYLGYALFTLKRKETKWHVLDVIMLSLFIYNLLPNKKKFCNFAVF
jgi:chromate transport protein ChrA